ncbi:MAG TPA: toll/interleukin-1 receptor domain-containing protein [Pyrinomonadaceae bacterium]|nr:toll/interleukin-1 receptor domain-containing protein [Pyrinomonadaceae bacterium]
MPPVDSAGHHDRRYRFHNATFVASQFYLKARFFIFMRHTDKIRCMIKLFFSYSHKDEDLRNELENHLTPLKRQRVIDTWHDRRISAGKDFGSEISAHLETSQIILLLISPYFIASDYCYEAEMMRALELNDTGKARVIPVILDPCDWQSLPFGNLQALPKDGKPISKYPNMHEALLEVARGVRAVAEEFRSARQTNSKAPSPQIRVVDPTSRVDDIRSSNLRVKKIFTQREKVKFEREAYEYIEKYFENSLAELQRRNSGIETEFRRIDANHFTAIAYMNGSEASRCFIGYEGGGGLIGGITYSYGSAGTTSFNEKLSGADDGYMLYLRMLGRSFRSEPNEHLTMEGAAEAYWEMFISRLQR